MIAILFVPLATLDGKPRKISSGSVKSDPPPDSVLIIPTKNPTTTKITILKNSQKSNNQL